MKKNSISILKYQENKSHYTQQTKEADITRSLRIIWATLIFLVIFLIWSYFFEITEFSKVRGSGNLTPRGEVIHALEGTLLSDSKTIE